MSKKLIAMLLSLTLMLSACSGNTDTEQTSDISKTETVTEPPVTQTTASVTTTVTTSSLAKPMTPSETTTETTSETTTETTSVTTTETTTETTTVTTQPYVDPTPIPVVHITTKSEILKDTYCDAEITIDGTKIKNAGAQIKGRGHSTWAWDKKPYKIKFDEKTSVLGMKKAKDWVLLANYADKSLIRNYVADEMAKSLSGIDYTLSQTPVSVYLNGEYIGIYTIGEQIEVKSGRVDIEKNTGEDDTGYLLEVGGKQSDDTVTVSYSRGFLQLYVIKYPEMEEITNSQVHFINEYIIAADEAITSGKGYEEYIDVDSFIDWFLLHEITYNIDSCMRRSCYLYKDKGGKLCMGPVWDFDMAFGNFSCDNQQYNDWVTVGTLTNDILDRSILNKMTPDDFNFDDNENYVVPNWYNFLLSDKKFVKKLKARWNNVKSQLLQSGLDAVDSGSYLIADEQYDNFTRWPILGSLVGFESYNTAYANPTYLSQVQYLRDFLKKRYNWIDENIKKL